MIIEMIKSNVLVPASTRMGSLAAGGLVAVGMTVDHANTVGLGVAALLGFGCDLILAWYRKRAIQKKAIASVGPLTPLGQQQALDAIHMEARRKARGE